MRLSYGCRLTIFKLPTYRQALAVVCHLNLNYIEVSFNIIISLGISFPVVLFTRTIKKIPFTQTYLMKLLILIIPIAFISCRTHNTQNIQTELRDSLIRQYLAFVDSIGWVDSLTAQHRLLVAYNINDTVFIKKEIQTIQTAIRENKKFLTPHRALYLRQLKNMILMKLTDLSIPQHFVISQ
jgi:hypothetical protein